jgi:hypothetical protein
VGHGVEHCTNRAIKKEKNALQLSNFLKHQQKFGTKEIGSGSQ